VSVSSIILGEESSSNPRAHAKAADTASAVSKAFVVRMLNRKGCN
jgi:hypothetical protein